MRSYDLVSSETRLVAQAVINAARLNMERQGQPQNLIKSQLGQADKLATIYAQEEALKDWRENRSVWSAELYFQRWTRILLRTFLPSQGHDPASPVPEFTTSTDGLPISPEFLKAIGKTEAQVLGMIKKEENPEKDSKLPLHTVPVFVKTEDSSPRTSNAPLGYANQLAQHVKEEPVSPFNTPVPGKRKNDEPESIASKYGRGNDGQRVPPESRSTNRTQEQWGAPLSAKDHQLMNIGLMTEIWSNRISQRHMSDYGGGLFEVRIPSDKTWQLLGKDISSVFRLISSEWRPIRLHTRESGAFMCVGLWVKKSQTQAHKAEVTRHTLPELYRLLRRWSLQAQGSGQAESLADFLTDYLGA